MINDGRVVSNFFVAALKGEELPIFGAGTQTRSFAYIDDITDTIVRKMDCSQDFTGPVNIGYPDEFTILELASLAIEFAGGSSNLTFHPARPDDPVCRRPDISLARERLKWEPKMALNAGLKITMDHFRRELGMICTDDVEAANVFRS